MNIFQNNKNTTEEDDQNKSKSIGSNQISQLKDREQYFHRLMKNTDIANRSREEFLALSYITQYKKKPVFLKYSSKERLLNSKNY